MFYNEWIKRTARCQCHDVRFLRGQFDMQMCHLLMPITHSLTHSLTRSLTQEQTLFVVSRPERERPSPTPYWNSNRAGRHVGMVTVQLDYSLKGVLRANLVAFISCFAKLKRGWLRMLEYILWPTWRLNFMSIWLVQALNMTKRQTFVCSKVTWKWVNPMLMR